MIEGKYYGKGIFLKINKNNQKIFDSMKINAQEIVEDPESYKEYIEKTEKVIKSILNDMNSISPKNKNSKFLKKQKLTFSSFKSSDNIIVKNDKEKENENEKNNEKENEEEIKKEYRIWGI